jgi:hypothetical protein
MRLLTSLALSRAPTWTAGESRAVLLLPSAVDDHHGPPGEDFYYLLKRKDHAMATLSGATERAECIQLADLEDAVQADLLSMDLITSYALELKL